MKNIFILFFLIPLVLLSQNNGETEIHISEVDNWKTHFSDSGLEGTFILTKLNSDSLLVYNFERSKIRYMPASTFKIPNSLIALEENAIIDENEFFKWDGQKRSFENWNQDQNLRTAIKYSCVWFYQELARRIGEEKMQYYLDTCKYGNAKMGANIDTFWLEGDIRISAYEQIEFLIKFLNKDLPFSERAFEIVKRIMLINSTDSYKYYAKTGWTGRVENEIGWYVGFIEKEGENWIFALNIDMNGIKDAKYRIEITESILESEGIIN